MRNTAWASVLLLALAAPGSAFAHTTLLRTAPANGSVLARAPLELRVVFDDVVRSGPDTEAIRNAGGSILAGRPHVEAGRTLVVPLRRGLRDGAYSVRWSIVSDDGHRESGVVAFAVGAGQPVPTAALSPATGQSSAAEVATRWIFFTGLLSSVGIALFALLARPRDEERVVLVLSTAAILTAVGAGEEAHRVGLETRAGTALAAGFVATIAVATLAGAASLDRRALRPALLLAIGLAAVPAVAGHALDRGLNRVNVVADVLHVTGAAAWVGVLIGFVALRDAPRRRIAALALGGLLMLGATGIVRASFELLHPSQLWDTSYGRALLVKTAILLVALGAGWLLRARLRRRAAVELVLAAGLVVAVSVLVTLRPGRNVVGVQRAAGVSPAAAACSSSSSRHTYQPIASRKTSVCSPFITMPPRFWSRIGDSPQRRCVCS
jgi:copper transport protein